jgi:hypothetical protein
MKLRILWQLLIWLFAGLVGLTIIYGMAIVSFSSEPKGAASSFVIFDHDQSDVVEFEKGIVIHRTCCGDSQWGTYARQPDGRWIWTIVDSKRYNVTTDGRRLDWWVIEKDAHEEIATSAHAVEIHPGLFSIRLSCESTPKYNATLRRRLFVSFPL